ncbi:MAG: restriction endonuclease subunit S, partial [Rhodanobacter sp.]
WFVQFDFPETNGRPYKSSGGAMVWNDTLKREIPAEWEAGSLRDAIHLEYGKPMKDSDRSGAGYPVMGSNGVVGYHNDYLIEGPGIVVGRKGTAGAVTYSHENFFPIDTTYYVKPRRTYKFNFLLHLLRSLPLTKLNSDSAVPGLNRDSALRLPVVLPPNNVVESFDTLTDAFTQKLKTSFFENRELTQLRDWLLPLLMNGQVRVA